MKKSQHSLFFFYCFEEFNSLRGKVDISDVLESSENHVRIPWAAYRNGAFTRLSCSPCCDCRVFCLETLLPGIQSLPFLQLIYEHLYQYSSLVTWDFFSKSPLHSCHLISVKFNWDEIVLLLTLVFWVLVLNRDWSMNRNSAALWYSFQYLLAVIPGTHEFCRIY